jgi:hypothetical protein
MILRILQRDLLDGHFNLIRGDDYDASKAT